MSGSPAYADFVPDEDDIVVERMRDAGAIIMGKTNVPEFGYSGVGHNPVFPTTRNPWNPALTSGRLERRLGRRGRGRHVPDGDRQRRRRLGPHPAHSGVFGMKASMGRVPLYPGCRDETLSGRVELGVARAYRPDHADASPTPR